MMQNEAEGRKEERERESIMFDAHSIRDATVDTFRCATTLGVCVKIVITAYQINHWIRFESEPRTHRRSRGCWGEKNSSRLAA